MNKPEQIKIIAEGKYLRYMTVNGWECVERHNCSGIVIIVALTGENELLFVEQFRPPVNNRVVEFPAGLVNDQQQNPPESVLDAARRELLEETGYQSEEMTVLMSGPVAGGACRDMVTLVLATGAVQVGPGGGDETEDLMVFKIPLEQAESWLLKRQGEGVYIEPKIYAGLHFLKT